MLTTIRRYLADLLAPADDREAAQTMRVTLGLGRHPTPAEAMERAVVFRGLRDYHEATMGVSVLRRA